MLVAEARLEPQHPLTDYAEAEMAGLYRTGMHRADRDFVHAITGDRYERIVIQAGHVILRPVKIVAQRETVGRPSPVTQPRPVIVAALRSDAEHVVDRALHPNGSGENSIDTGIRELLPRHR